MEKAKDALILALGLMAAFVVGCAANRTQITTGIFPRAVVEPAQVQAAMDFEQRLRAQGTNAPPVGSNWFVFLNGSSRVLISAPHATSQVREGRVKRADGGSGGLAMALHDLVKTPLLITIFQSPSDPNYYDTNAFKEALANIIATNRPAIVLDFHVSDSRRPYEIDFGTMKGSSLNGRTDLLIKVVDCLKKEGFQNFSQDFFPASKSKTVTKFVSAPGIPCIQREFNATWVGPDHGLNGGHRFAHLLQALVRFANEIDATSSHSP